MDPERESWEGVGGGGCREREERRRSEEGEREGRNRAEGRKKRKLVCPFLMIVTTCDYEILLVTPLSCSPPTISRKVRGWDKIGQWVRRKGN